MLYVCLSSYCQKDKILTVIMLKCAHGKMKNGKYDIPDVLVNTETHTHTKKKISLCTEGVFFTLIFMWAEKGLNILFHLDHIVSRCPLIFEIFKDINGASVKIKTAAASFLEINTKIKLQLPQLNDILFLWKSGFDRNWHICVGC